MVKCPRLRRRTLQHRLGSRLRRQATVQHRPASARRRRPSVQPLLPTVPPVLPSQALVGTCPLLHQPPRSSLPRARSHTRLALLTSLAPRRRPVLGLTARLPRLSALHRHASKVWTDMACLSKARAYVCTITIITFK